MSQEIRNHPLPWFCKQRPIDPTLFKDPIALRTDWFFVSSVTKDYSLIPVDSDRFEYRASIKALLTYWSFIFVIAWVVLVIVIKPRIANNQLSSSAPAIWIILSGLALLVVGVFALQRNAARAVFDKRKGAFWKGRKTLDGIGPNQKPTDCVRLEEIHALQLISMSQILRGRYVYCYQLNLILEDGHRINIVLHNDPNRIRQDAQVLSRYLDKPVWDAF